MPRDYLVGQNTPKKIPEDFQRRINKLYERHRELFDRFAPEFDPHNLEEWCFYQSNIQFEQMQRAAKQAISASALGRDTGIRFYIGGICHTYISQSLGEGRKVSS